MKLLTDPKTGRFLKGTRPPQTGIHKPRSGTKECPICHKIFNWKLKKIMKKSGYYAYDGVEPQNCSKECRYKAASISRLGKQKEGTIRFDRKEKRKAQRVVQRLVKQGVIEKKPCKICGDMKTQAHHYKGYEPEYWLNIVWFCDRHHKEEHIRLRSTGESLLL